jgi:light-regulated signal transduction histidine kinase (bacteriophytochrome)
VIDDSKDQINPLKVEMQYDEAKEIMVKVDKEKVAEVLCNLLDNAGKFTDNGMISINTEQQDDMVVVSLRDTGAGIEILKSWTGFLQNLPQRRTTVPPGWGFTYQRRKSRRTAATYGQKTTKTEAAPPFHSRCPFYLARNKKGLELKAN